MAILVGLGVIYGIVRLAKSGGGEESKDPKKAPLAGAVEMDFTTPLGTPLRPGDTVNRETLLRFEQDPGITDLAKEAFAKAAQGAQVSWDLQLGNLTPRQEGPIGTFQIPYTANLGNASTRGGTLQVRVEFAGTDDSLLSLRRDDWVRVAGTLDLTNDRITIRNASVIQPP